MDIKQELQRISEYQNALLPRHEKKSEQGINTIVDVAFTTYQCKTYDFSKYDSICLNQAGKLRKVKMYQPFSPEELLCIYLKRLLDRKFHISYPNRNAYMRSLFNTTCALKDMSDYTIFKFDFEDFFNSISSVYVYKKYMQNKSFERYQSELLENFVISSQYAYAGLNTSNIICEIVAKQFDQLLSQRLSQYGVILYRRYIDDGIIIFNSFVDKVECMDIINDVIKEIFFDSNYTDALPCKTCLNVTKTKYIARRLLTAGGKPQEFDFLGYQFELTLKQTDKTEKTVFQYGITQQKIEKYSRRINSIVKDYATSQEKDMQLMRHQIKAFTHRTVYRVNRYKNVIWKSKGFISNYCELRYRMDELTPATKKFLKTAVFKAFSNNGIKLPYFLRCSQDESIYSLYNNMKNYRTLLFVESIGIGYSTLEKMCGQVGISTNPIKDYDGLVRDYLITVKIGH
ncbi:reverse transcriptase domain-containing protein [Faecalimonas sp.]